MTSGDLFFHQTKKNSACLWSGYAGSREVFEENNTPFILMSIGSGNRFFLDKLYS